MRRERGEMRRGKFNGENGVLNEWCLVIWKHCCPVKNNRIFATLRKTRVCDELEEGGLSGRLRRPLSPPKNTNVLSF
jgi:hypothetical protein